MNEAGCGLAVHTFGPETGPCGLWVHGWMGCGADGEKLAAQLNMRLCCPDLPGHGRTPIDSWRLADVLQALSVLAKGMDFVAGYSMGARLLMMSAAQNPEAFDRMILESGFPGYAGEEDREDRRETDRERADQLRRQGLELFCRDWYAKPMWGGMPAFTRSGDPLSIAKALERFSSGRQPDLRPWLRYTPQRILWLAGARDPAYADLADWVRTQTRHRVRVLDAGHAVHRMCPEAWASDIQSFIHEPQLTES